MGCMYVRINRRICCLDCPGADQRDGYDQQISSKYYFLNAPEAQTRREASQLFFSRKEFSEPSPPAASSESIFHQITHPASLDTIIDRQVVLQNDDK